MSNILSYKPSAFYYRRDIRAARSKAAVQTLANRQVTEMEMLYQWIYDNGFAPRGGIFPPSVSSDLTAFDYRSRISAGRSKADVIECALTVVLEHENLRQWVRDVHKVIPPKWYLSPSEQQAKQDEEADAV
ncbi:MAG: hypothetical protein NTV51_12365 [Verrucomicrobia bacterium]|nr:hypothetical protein [Verrucomicrobiota bacterium]